MTQRPSEPILNWLREYMKEHAINIAEMAVKTGEPKGTVRRLLSGQEPMTLDQLIHWTQCLDVRIDDLVTPAMVREPEPPAGLRAVTPAEDPPEPNPFHIDPYALQGEQAVRLAFAMGVTFTFIVDSTLLDDRCGVPNEVRVRFPERMPIQLDAAYHRYNEPSYDERGLGLTLSFGGTKHRSFFPWSTIHQVVYFLDAPDPLPDPDLEEVAPARPTLRLVT